MMKRSFKNALKATLAWALTFAMVFGLIGIYTNTEVQANDDGGTTLYYYYPDDDGGTPAITNNNISTSDCDFIYWSRGAMLMTASGLGDGWYEIELTADMFSGGDTPYFQIIISYDGSDATDSGDNTGFIMNLCCNDGNYASDDALNDSAEIIGDAIENGTDVYMTSEITSTIEDAGIDTIVFTSQTDLEETLEVYYLEVKKLQVNATYYIGGCELETADDWDNQAGGIFAGAYEYVQMNPDENNEAIWYYSSSDFVGEIIDGDIVIYPTMSESLDESAMATAGYTYYYDIFYLPEGDDDTDNMWGNVVGESFSFTPSVDCYVVIILYGTLDYTDDGTPYISDFTTEVRYFNEDGEEIINETTFYFNPSYCSGNYDGSTPYLAFSSAINGLELDGYYYGRYCYAATAVDGYDGWYSFTIRDTYGDFQLVCGTLASVSSKSESDNESCIWLENIQSDTYSEINFSEDANVFYIGKFYTSIEDALENTEYLYYVAGATTAEKNLEAEYNGTSNNIFSNYWAADVKVADDGTYYTDENWLDQLSEESDGVYSITLSNKAVAGTEYKYQICVNRTWTSYASKTFTALADAYVKILYYADTQTTEVVYLDDDGNEIDVAESTTFYFYYDGDDTPYIVFESAISGLDVAGYYWGKYCYAVTDEGDGWYSFTLLNTYGGFQLVYGTPATDSSLQDDGELAWIADINTSTVYSDIDFSLSANYYYKGSNGNIYYSKSDALSATTTYYIAGSVTDWETAGIFDGYWSLVELSETVTDGVYTIILPNKAVYGTQYAFNIYENGDWNSSALGSNAIFTADYDATVQIEYDSSTGLYTIYYLDDDGVAFAVDEESTSISSVNDDGDDDTDADDDDTSDGSSSGSDSSSNGSGTSTGAKTGDTYPVEAAAAAALIALAVMYLTRKRRTAE